MTFTSDGQRVFDIELEALQRVRAGLDTQFEQACTLVRACAGRVVVTGMGKSGHIANKIAASLASTGTPAFFVHPGEASHGDLGMITPVDLVIALSNSGSTPEVLSIVPIIKRMGVKLISMTGDAESELAKIADAHLDVSIDREACPHNLAPTASTTAALAMGDALMVAVLQSRGFSANDFARTHPGGALGKRLLLYVSDLMHQGDDIPLVADTASFKDVLLEMTSKSLGMTGVIDNQKRLIGMITDGDLRRTLGTGFDAENVRAADIMTHTPFTVPPDTLAADVVKAMREYAIEGPHAINAVFITDDDNHALGALNTHDLLRAGVV